MSEEKSQKKSNLILVLREGVAVVQMVLFKEIRAYLEKKSPTKDKTNRSMLTGAIINSLFGTENPTEKFQQFNKENRAEIEQEILGLPENLPQLLTVLTDALRVQTLCDSQEGEDSSQILRKAEDNGVLIKDRELPLPSSFMTIIRQLGEEHGLTIAPTEISEEDDSSIVH